MTFNIITLFPEFFDSPLKTGVLGRAVTGGFVQSATLESPDTSRVDMKYENANKTSIFKIRFINPRDFAHDKHKKVDDSPFGGGDGMVMLSQPLKLALESLPQTARKKVVYVSPQGRRWSYKMAREWAEQGGEWTFISGRYAGVDQRFISRYVTEEVSIGDYVLTGGEPAILVILDSLSRFVKGVLGNEESAKVESFENHGLLEAPQWTKPKEMKGYKIPEVLFSGHHQKIQEFRYLMSVLVTAVKRPALLRKKEQRVLPLALKMVSGFSKEELLACGLSYQDLLQLKSKTENPT